MSSIIRRLGPFAVAALLCASNAAADGFFIEPEAVFLRFSENEFDFAVEGDTGVIEDGTIIDIDSDYSTGYRIALGYGWEGWWDVTVRHTHVDDSGHGTATDDRGALWGTSIHPTEAEFSADEFVRIDAELDLDLDYTDVEIGKRWNCENGGFLRLFFGLRFSWLDQDSAAIHYASETVWEVTQSHLDWKGWGPLVGLTGQHPLGRESGWSVFGTVAGSLQFGDLDGDFSSIYVPASTMSPESDVLNFAYADDEDTTASVVEGRIGFGWQREFDRVTFSLRFGYEYQRWNDLATTNSLIANAIGRGPLDAGSVETTALTCDASPGTECEELQGNEDIGVHGFFFGLGWAW